MSIAKNVDGAHLHHKEILHAKFGKSRTIRFRSSARTDIHTIERQLSELQLSEHFSYSNPLVDQTTIY